MKTVLFLALLLPCTALAQKTITVFSPESMAPRAHGGPVNRPDKAPQYPGGSQAMGKFFHETIQYPEADRVKEITGNVLLSATIGPDGHLNNVSVAQSLSPACDAEALRVVALMPAWQPATRKGQPLPVSIQLPVPFGNADILTIEK